VTGNKLLRVLEPWFLFCKIRKILSIGAPGWGFSYWAYYPQASAALPWIQPILSHQEVDLASHFHVVDPPTGFVAFPSSLATRLFIVPPSLNVLDEPIHGEDSLCSSTKTLELLL